MFPTLVSSSRHCFGGRHGHYAFKWVFFGGREWKHTVANVGIRLFELLTKRATPKKQGMVAGGVFRPIPSKTPLGLTRHHPYDPFCNFKHGRNPIFAKVMAILNELSAKSGTGYAQNSKSCQKDEYNIICRRSFCKKIGQSPIQVTLIKISFREKGKDLAGMVFVPAFFLCLKLP